jgi:hypothetical protein
VSFCNSTFVLLLLCVCVCGTAQQHECSTFSGSSDPFTRSTDPERSAPECLELFEPEVWRRASAETKKTEKRRREGEGRWECECNTLLMGLVVRCALSLRRYMEEDGKASKGIRRTRSSSRDWCAGAEADMMGGPLDVVGLPIGMPPDWPLLTRSKSSGRSISTWIDHAQVLQRHASRLWTGEYLQATKGHAFECTQNTHHTIRSLTLAHSLTR